jgi:hypothetical protein
MAGADSMRPEDIFRLPLITGKESFSRQMDGVDRERPLADTVAPGDLGLTALVFLVGGEHPLAQVGGVGTRRRSSPLGLEHASTAGYGAGCADSPAVHS